jgi:hypothetical protein
MRNFIHLVKLEISSLKVHCPLAGDLQELLMNHMEVSSLTAMKKTIVRTKNTTESFYSSLKVQYDRKFL